MVDWIREVVESPQLTWAILPAAFLLGITAAATSSCNVAALGAIAGYSGAREGEERKGMLLAGLFFLLGTVIALAVLGATAGFISQIAGKALGKYWQVFAGLAAVFFGLAALNLVPFKLPSIGAARKERSGGLVGAAIFGLAVGGGATACTTACNPIIAVPLALAALQGETLRAAIMLAAFAVGFSVPLAAILVGLSFGKSVFKARKAAVVIRIVSGALLVVAGFYLLATVPRG